MLTDVRKRKAGVIMDLPLPSKEINLTKFKEDLEKVVDNIVLI